MHWVQAKGIISEQWRTKSYGIDIFFNIEDIELEFEWYLAKPSSLWQAALLDNFNEFMSEKCHEFVEKYQLKFNEWISVTWSALYRAVMEMIIESVNDIQERWDSLFIIKSKDVQLRKLKRKRKKKLDELEALKDEEKSIEWEIEKQKLINETKREMIAKMWIEDIPVQATAPATAPAQATTPKKQFKTKKGVPSEPKDLSNLR